MTRLGESMTNNEIRKELEGLDNLVVSLQKFLKEDELIDDRIVDELRNVAEWAFRLSIIIEEYL